MTWFDKKEEELESKELHELRKIKGELHELVELARGLVPKLAMSATLTFKGANGMPANIIVGKTATAVFTEFVGPGGTGDKVPPVGPVVFASDNPAVATVDSVTGIATGVSNGSANISGADQGNGLTNKDILTVGPVVAAQSATLVLTANP